MCTSVWGCVRVWLWSHTRSWCVHQCHWTCVCFYTCGNLFCMCMHVPLHDRWTNHTTEQHRLGSVWLFQNRDDQLFACGGIVWKAFSLFGIALSDLQLQVFNSLGSATWRPVASSIVLSQKPPSPLSFNTSSIYLWGGVKRSPARTMKQCSFEMKVVILHLCKH